MPFKTTNLTNILNGASTFITDASIAAIDASFGTVAIAGAITPEYIPDYTFKGKAVFDLGSLDTASGFEISTTGNLSRNDVGVIVKARFYASSSSGTPLGSSFTLIDVSQGTTLMTATVGGSSNTFGVPEAYREGSSLGSNGVWLHVWVESLYSKPEGGPDDPISGQPITSTTVYFDAITLKAHYTSEEAPAPPESPGISDPYEEPELVARAIRESGKENLAAPINMRFRGHREADKFNLMLGKFIGFAVRTDGTLTDSYSKLLPREMEIYPSEAYIQRIYHLREQIRYFEWNIFKNLNDRWWFGA